MRKINPVSVPVPFPGSGEKTGVIQTRGVITRAQSKEAKRTLFTDYNSEQLHSPDYIICHLYKMSYSILLNLMKTQ